MSDGEPLQAGQRAVRREAARAAKRRRRPRTRAATLVAEPHRRQLEGLIDLLRTALELEARCDFGDGPLPDGPGRAVFLAHFDGWREALVDWEERVREARAAPAALWAEFDDAARRMGVPEPPLAIGPLVDRLATLTAQRSRDGCLSSPHALYMQSLKSGHGEGTRTIVYVEGQNVAQLRGDNHPLAAELEARIQHLFDTMQRSQAAVEVGRASDAVTETKQLLLSRLNRLAAADAIVFAPSCPVCGASAGRAA